MKITVLLENESSGNFMGATDFNKKNDVDCLREMFPFFL